MGIFGGYKASKLKPQLKMAVTRFQISANKKSALMKQQIREIARLLAEDPPKEEKARIKAEALIRDDNTVEAYEILQLNCELLSERIHLISHSKECPPDLVSCVSTMIWSSVIVDIPELIEIRNQFKYKYGKVFYNDAMQNVGGILNDRVVARLSVQPPSAYLVQTYLEKIADEHEVDWKPKVPLKAEEISNPMAAPCGYSVPVGGGSGLNPSSFVEGAMGPNTNDGVSASAPPVSPSFGHIPAAPGSSASTVSSMSTAYVPVLPTPSTPKPPPTTIDEIEETDIYVPGAPKSPPGGVKYSNKKDDNNDDDGGDGGGEVAFPGTQSAGEGSKGAGGGTDESYNDLAARFAQLQR